MLLVVSEQYHIRYDGDIRDKSYVLYLTRHGVFDFCASRLRSTLVFADRLPVIADLGIFKDELPSITEAYGDFTLCFK